MKLWNAPFWRQVASLACAGIAVMIVVAVFNTVGPAIVKLFSTKPFDYTYVQLKAEDGIDSIQSTDPMDNGGFLVATMTTEHDGRRVKGGIHLGSGPCDAPERTWGDGWMAIHSAGTGAVLPIPRGHCWNAILIGGAEEAVLWILMDRKWWQPRARMTLRRNRDKNPSAPPPVPPFGPQSESTPQQAPSIPGSAG